MGAMKSIAKAPRLPPNPTIFPHVIQNKQEMWLHWYEWWPRSVAAKEVKGVIFLASGLGEHGMRYDGFAEEMAEAFGFAVFSLDHQGHGLSEGDRKHVENFTFYVDDYLQFMMTVMGKYGPSNKHSLNLQDLPRFLIGHSMGGLISLRVARECAKGIPAGIRAIATTGATSITTYGASEPTVGTTAASPNLFTSDNQFFFNGVVLSGPAIKPDPALAKPILVKMSKVLANMAPKLSIGNLDTNEICGNPQVVENAKNDYLFPKDPLRARFGYEMLMAMTEVQEKPKSFLNFPLLLLHGELDVLALPDGSVALFNAASEDDVEFPDKKFVLYKGLKHEIFNEVGDAAVEVRLEVKSFIRAHLGYLPNETKLAVVSNGASVAANASPAREQKDECAGTK